MRSRLAKFACTSTKIRRALEKRASLRNKAILGVAGVAGIAGAKKAKEGFTPSVQRRMLGSVTPQSY